MTRKTLEGPLDLLPLAVKKNWDLDLEGLKENITFLKDSHIPGFIALGSMGEFFTLTEEEFRQIVDTAMDAAGNLVSVFGTTFQNTAESIRRTKYAEDAGADGVMIAPPYVIGLEPDSVFKHYQAINNSIKDIQIMVYNYPPLPNINIGPEIWDKLLTLDRVKAVKESNGDVYHRTVVLNKIAKKINVFSGCEAWFLFDAMMGARGIVSIFGHSIPKTVLEFYNQCRDGEYEKALDWHFKFVDSCYYISATNEVSYLKTIAELAGRKTGPPRPPYDNQPVDPAVRERLKKLIESGA